MTYYKTTDISPDRLQERIHRADSQEGLILAYFNQRPGNKFTASDVERALKGSNIINDRVPITSIRRAMSSLQKEGKINRMSDTKTGPHGDPEHYYQLSTGWGKGGYSEQQPSDLPSLF